MTTILPLACPSPRYCSASGTSLNRYLRSMTVEIFAAWQYVFGNRVAEDGLDRVYQGKREPDHRVWLSLR
jgi:hypothetical protein